MGGLQRRTRAYMGQSRIKVSFLSLPPSRFCLKVVSFLFWNPHVGVIRESSVQAAEVLWITELI